jgi:hypothetical protein
VAVTGAPIDVIGLKAWVTKLKGPEFRDVNNALRAEAMTISQSLVPEVQKALAQSSAPQAKAMVDTVKPKRDRVPVLAVGAINPKFSKVKRGGREVSAFTRRGKGAEYHRRRRGAIAHGVIFGTKGGHLKGGGDYYKIGRSESGGAFGRYVNSGPAFDKACEAYFTAYKKVLREHGLDLNGNWRQNRRAA